MNTKARQLSPLSVEAGDMSYSCKRPPHLTQTNSAPNIRRPHTHLQQVVALLRPEAYHIDHMVGSVSIKRLKSVGV